jgi:glycosyltransferase involved in cell wall biosynthesis
VALGWTLTTFMRILIAEEALQSGKGHWPGYIGGIAGGMRVAGDEVDVLVHREATATVLEQVGGRPWFSRSCWVDAASQGALGGIRHNFTFREELANWLRERPPYDWVCALTMRLQHLLAFALLSNDSNLPSATRFLLLFVQGFGQYVGPGKPTAFQSTLSNRLARFCFRLLAPAVRSGRVVLAAETKGMQDELQRFTGLPVSLFPHPVEARSERGERKTETRDLQTVNCQPPSANSITLTCPGFARHEKGNDLLQEAILEILAGPDGDRFHFVMQWPEPFALPDGRLLGPDPRLVADPRVEFLNQSLDTTAYEALLARSDFVILPYRRDSYHHRVSRVAIEAASRGIPLVYTSGTWTAEIAELAGCGAAIADETPVAIVEALLQAVGMRSEFASCARESAQKVVDHHYAGRFRSLLVERM